MKKFIFDACSLIYLTKINLKEELPKLGDLIVSFTVKNELIEDINRFEDAKILRQNLKKKLIKESNYKLKNIFASKNLGKGEKDTIEICLKDEGIPVTDDHQALNLALNVGLKPKTSEVILLELLQESVINFEMFKISFDKLAQIKALKPEIVNLLYKKAKKINQIRKKNQKEENK